MSTVSLAFLASLVVESAMPVPLHGNDSGFFAGICSNRFPSVAAGKGNQSAQVTVFILISPSVPLLPLPTHFLPHTSNAPHTHTPDLRRIKDKLAVDVLPGGAMASPIPCNCADCVNNTPKPKSKIAIIGSGASGLTVMKELTALGHEVGSPTAERGNGGQPVCATPCPRGEKREAARGESESRERKAERAR